MTEEPLFTLRPEDYKRNIDIVAGANEQAALFLHKKTNLPYEQCLDWVQKKTAPGAEFGITDPKAQCLVKFKPGERTRTSIPFTRYLQDVMEKGRLISPTMAVYLPETEKPSLISEYIAGNIKARADFKKLQFEAEQRGDAAAKSYYNIQQTSTKLKNNGLSGAHANDHNPLFNSSTHSTLTSTCRTVTSTGAAKNEKLLSGHRHYHSPHIVIWNILSIAQLTNLAAVEAVMTKYNLVYPTAENVMECINRSANRYWLNKKKTAEIFDLVKTLAPIERAAFVYVDDLYHLAKWNHEFVREFIGKLAHKGGEVPDNPDAVLKAMDTDKKTLVTLLCRDEMRRGHPDGQIYTIYDLKTAHPDRYLLVAATCNRINGVLESYRDMIKAFWVTDNLPASIANLPTITRDVVITFDTDSNIFTTEYWTEWYVGKLDFSEMSCNVSFVIAFLTSQCIVHALAQTSANMGIPTRHIHRLAMKNEYWFPLFTLTSMAKHYYALQAAVEGQLKVKMELEAKGVNLRSSLVAKEIMDGFHDFLMELMIKVMEEGTLDVDYLLDHVAFKEETIRQSILHGNPAFMKRMQIKAMKSYKNPESSNYIHYNMWQEVFAEKYGPAPVPPYTATNVTLDFKNPTDVKAWLENMEDREIADKMLAYMKKIGRDKWTAFYLPAAIVREKGIPKEIEPAINTRKLIFGVLTGYYLMLESLGIFMINDNLTRLVSDYHVIRPDSPVLK